MKTSMIMKFQKFKPKKQSINFWPAQKNRTIFIPKRNLISFFKSFQQITIESSIYLSFYTLFSLYNYFQPFLGNNKLSVPKIVSFKHFLQGFCCQTRFLKYCRNYPKKHSIFTDLLIFFTNKICQSEFLFCSQFEILHS